MYKYSKDGVSVLTVLDKRKQKMNDYTYKNSNVTTIHINTAEDLQKYIQDKMK